MRIVITLILLSLLVSSCNRGTSQKISDSKTNTTKVQEKVDHVSFLRPIDNEDYTLGDDIDIQLSFDSENLNIDSIVFFMDKKRISQINKEYTWRSDRERVGRRRMKIITYYKTGQKEYDYRNLIFKSDLVPEIFIAKVKKTYDHDVKAYTQGLIFEDGIMYEGTGQNGESTLRKVNFETGQIMASLSIPNEYFGEGVTIFGDKIYQLTWTSKTGFVYDKKDFRLLHTFQYPTQGWGLTTDGEKLYMSDGSATIFVLEHEFFTELDRFEVYDNMGRVNSLNELEYINGLIYANVYQSDYFVVIDPNTGKVIQKILCSHLVPEQYKNDRDNVLNGIAYDKDSDRLFITGKRWPVLYEIEFPGR